MKIRSTSKYFQYSIQTNEAIISTKTVSLPKVSEANIIINHVMVIDFLVNLNGKKLYVEFNEKISNNVNYVQLNFIQTIKDQIPKCLLSKTYLITHLKVSLQNAAMCTYQ